MDWTQELSTRCCLNREYREAMEELQKLEPEFAALRNTLSEQN